MDVSGEPHTASSSFATSDLCDEMERLVRIERKAAWLLCHHFAELADRFDEADPALSAYDDIYQLGHMRLGMPKRAVRERVRVGRSLRLLPQIRLAFAEGAISFAKVREVTRVAEPASEEHWLHAARSESVRSLERSVARAKHADAPAASPERVEKRSSDGAVVDVQLRLPATTWALVQRAMDAARARSQGPLSDAQALEAVARYALARPTSGGEDDERFLDDLASRADADIELSETTRPGQEEASDAPEADSSTETTRPAQDEMLTPAPGRGAVSPEYVDAARAIVALIERGEGSTAEELIRRAKLSVSCVAVTVLELELAGIVAETHRGLMLTPWGRRHHFNVVPSKLRH